MIMMGKKLKQVPFMSLNMNKLFPNTYVQFVSLAQPSQVPPLLMHVEK